MEGITYAAYRAVHARMFPGVKEYYTPFIAPDTTGSFKPRYLRELTADRAEGLCVIPQLLASRPEPFCATAEKLLALGFEEIDLNLGCPSGTVVAKHKGSGMLRDLPALDAFLDAVFSDAAQKGYRISIKTRMGVQSTGEFPAILAVYRHYPLSRLIIHARSREGYYQSIPDLAGFAEAAAQCPFPVTYNGNLFSRRDLDALRAASPETGSVMVGRGAVADPALIRTLSGGAPLRCEELRTFHDTLLEAYLQNGISPAFTAERMKHLWYYLHCMFADCKKEHKAILKAGTLPDYRAAVNALFASGKFDGTLCFADSKAPQAVL